MNGIFIKGASLPENCFECPCMAGGICFVAPSDQDGLIADTVDELREKGGKPDWCPMVEADEGELARHGQWDQLATFLICSKCKTPSKYQHPFCPKCGAKMDGGDSE